MNEAALSEYDYTVVVDSSGSMGEPNKKGVAYPTRWEAMQESVMAFVRDMEKLDSDGIDVVQLGGVCKITRNVTSQNVRDLFATMSPRGGTPLHTALERAFEHGSNKKKFIVVFTDGVPDDEKALTACIKKQANSQTTDEECTVLFVQVGDDAHATKYLNDLDDHLTGAKFDIVDAMTIDEADKFSSITDLITKAISD